MIQVKLADDIKQSFNGVPVYLEKAYALRTPAGIWKYLNGSGQADGAKTVPHAESMIAEALYQQFTAPSRAGRVLGLPDGSLFTSLSEGKWALHNPSQGSTIAHLSDYEAEYLTNLAIALGTDVLLANAEALEHRLREVQSVAAARADEIKRLLDQVDAQASMLEKMTERLESNAGTMQLADLRILQFLKTGDQLYGTIQRLREGLEKAGDEIAALRGVKLWPLRTFWAMLGAVAACTAFVVWGQP